MAKKSVQKVFDKDLNLKDLKTGMILSDSTRHPIEWKVDNDLIEQIRKFEQVTKYNAIWKGKLTGHFIYYKWIEEHPEYLEQKTKSKAEKMERMRKVKANKKKEKIKEEVKIEELEEKEAEDEENLMLDAIEDYKTEFGVKSVNTKSKKFKAFFEEWKNSN